MFLFGFKDNGIDYKMEERGRKSEDRAVEMTSVVGTKVRAGILTSRISC